MNEVVDTVSELGLTHTHTHKALIIRHNHKKIKTSMQTMTRHIIQIIQIFSTKRATIFQMFV